MSLALILLDLEMYRDSPMNSSQSKTPRGRVRQGRVTGGTHRVDGGVKV